MAQSGVSRELGRSFGLFARVAAARGAGALAAPLPGQSGPAAGVATRGVQELREVWLGLAGRLGPIVVGVSEQCFLRRGAPLEEPSPRDSIAPALHRHGIRGLELRPGLALADVEVLVEAAARALEFDGFGEDAATFLDRSSLETASVARVAPESTLPEELAWILGALAGDDGGTASIPELASRLEEQRLLEPVRSLRLEPAYGAALQQELAAEDVATLEARAFAAMSAAVASELDEAGADHVARGILSRLDELAAAGDLTGTTLHLRALAELRASDQRLSAWLDAGASEGRIRRVIAQHRAQGGNDTTGLVELFRACGARAAPAILQQLALALEPPVRRRFAELLFELGAATRERVEELIRSGHEGLLREGVYLLSRLGTPEALQQLTALASDPRPDARVAVAEVAAAELPGEVFELIARLARDPHPKVRFAASASLAKIGGSAARELTEQRARHLEDEDAPLEVKVAILTAYAELSGAGALRLLAGYAAKGEGILVKREVEDLAVAAAMAMRKIPTHRSIETLKKLCVVRNKRLREAARDVLVRMKEGVE